VGHWVVLSNSQPQVAHKAPTRAIPVLWLGPAEGNPNRGNVSETGGSMDRSEVDRENALCEVTRVLFLPILPGPNGNR
jgi:hypothetical protein